MKRVVAIQRVRYNKILRVPGTESAEFDARPQDVRVLVALRKVRMAEAQSIAVPSATVPSATPAVVTTRSMTAQDPSKAGTLDTEGYLRRDVTTENMVNKDDAKDKDKEKEKEVLKGRSKYLKEDVEKELAKEQASKSKTARE